MSILGIDYKKCIKCEICVTVCPLFVKEKKKIVFQNIPNFCNLCGHCISMCPENAILYEGNQEGIAYEGVINPENIATYDTVFKILQVNRSIRRYEKEKVPVDVLKKVFKAMSYAPTGGNMRLERFSILSDQEKIRQLSDAVQEELLKNPLTIDKYKILFKFWEKFFFSPIYFDAPHVVFVTSPLFDDTAAHNIGIIITYGRLAAQALGLGTCWNGLTRTAMYLNPKIKKLAGIRGKKLGIFTIGYPNEIYFRSSPRSVKHVIGLEKKQ